VSLVNAKHALSHHSDIFTICEEWSGKCRLCHEIHAGRFTGGIVAHWSTSRRPRTMFIRRDIVSMQRRMDGRRSGRVSSAIGLLRRFIVISLPFSGACQPPNSIAVSCLQLVLHSSARNREPSPTLNHRSDR